MADEEYKKLQEALMKAPTAEARKAAAEAMRKYLATRKKSSTPTLVSLALGKQYPTSIKLENIPDEIEKNPEFFKHLKKILSKKN